MRGRGDPDEDRQANAVTAQHDDEVRSPSEVEELRIREIADNPAAFLQRYRGMAARAHQDKARMAELEKRPPLNALDSIRTELDAAREDAKSAKALLAQMQSDLQAARDERQQLFQELIRVRHSRTFRLGKALLAPLHLVRRSPKKVTPTSTELPEAPREPVPSAVAAADGAGARPSVGSSLRNPADAASHGSSAARVRAESKPPVGERTLEELRADLEDHPSPLALSYVINREWYAHGRIEEPARLVREHLDLVGGLPAKASTLVDRVLGEDRLRQADLPIPPRAPGAVFPCEPDRVMYCVHSTPVHNSNGYSMRTRGVAEGLLAAGVDVRVVARPGYPWDSSTDRAKPKEGRSVTSLGGVPYIHLKAANLARTPIDRFLMEAADAFTREALLQRPSVIQAASNNRTALPALIAARRVGVPFVYEVRGFWEMSQAASSPSWDGSEQYHAQSELETRVAREADHVLAITRQVAEELVRRGVPAERIAVAPNAVDTTRFLPLPRDVAYARKHNIRTDAPVIGYAGSMVSYEGLDLLLRASVELDARGVEHQVVLAGSGAAQKDLADLQEEIGARSVLFLGRLPSAEMPRLLSTFDIMPLPRRSLPVTEMVSPLKPLEAFAAQKAVIMSDVAPHRDLAGERQERAVLFAADQYGALADALESLIRDRDRRARLGRAARLWTLDERTWERIAQTMRTAHAAAATHTYQAALDLGETRSLADLRVGLIADEFTTATLSASVTVIPLDRERWRDQLAEEDIHLVLVESAWSGNDRQWHRGIGEYESEEHEDIRELLASCRELGIPTAFWNKEDPIHFARFRATAALCDHVFTTDGGIIQKYLETPGAQTRTVASMPFFAQPAIHRPLPTDRPYQHTVAFAGTYYGERYEERSADLLRLLRASKPFGLTIYDRQAAIPNSPYRFPTEFASDVQGALPYSEVIASYSSHLAHLNGNSVGDSPTMFSRRVVEIPACGGIVLSGPGRGVEEAFGGVIPATRDTALMRALLHAWSTDPVERIREAWRQMRAVYRSRTIGTALTVMVRTCGVPLEAPAPPTYALMLTESSDELLSSILQQSRRPTELFVADAEVNVVRERLAGFGIRVEGWSQLGSTRSDWVGHLDAPVSRTWFEDLLIAERFGSWSRLVTVQADETAVGRTLAEPGVQAGQTDGLVRSDLVPSAAALREALQAGRSDGLTWLVAPPHLPHADAAPSALPTTARTAAKTPQGRTPTVLVAGHDLKFATGIIAGLEQMGCTVLRDQWQSHTAHEEDTSRELLGRADIVFCEWGLGNAVWYSQNLRSDQRLVVRVHSQELFRPYLSRIRHDRVSAYVFVGDLIRQAAVASHGVPESRTVVIPNPVRSDTLALSKLEGSAKTIGFVGMVPRSKRPDLAVDVLEALLEKDPGYRLRIKGRRPEDFPWMQERAEEMEYYRELDAHIDAINKRHPGAIVFDPHGDDMPEWFRGIGVALSTSEFESFHFTIADGAASGALPVSLAWPGSDLLYPRQWLRADVAGLVNAILTADDSREDDRAWIRERYASSVVLPRLLTEILGSPLP